MSETLLVSSEAFGAFAVLALVCSILMILKKNPVTSAVNMVVVFFSFAALYAMLSAHLIAALQVLVYAGAIMVLFVFVIMLLNADVVSTDLKRSSVFTWLATISSGLCLTLFFVMAFKQSDLDFKSGELSAQKVIEYGGNTRVLSEVLFTEYILPFELTSILLLIGILSAISIAKRNRESGQKKGMNP